MRKPDKRTREQRKADESALIAAVCLGATILLIAISILATSAQAVDAEPEEAPIVEEYDPAWDIPATESAVCNDVFLGEFTLTAYCPGRCCCGKWASGYTATGTLATEGRTIAVDPKVIPYGTHVLLIWPDGTQREYIAEDCGGGVNGNHIDVFLTTIRRRAYSACRAQWCIWRENNDLSLHLLPPHFRRAGRYAAARKSRRRAWLCPRDGKVLPGLRRGGSLFRNLQGRRR